jgi:hypothetical protein
MRFIPPGEDSVKPNSRPPFGCCLVIWGNELNHHSQDKETRKELA